MAFAGVCGFVGKRRGIKIRRLTMTKPSPNLIFLALRMAAAIRELHRWNAAVARMVEQGVEGAKG